ncbi:MAG: DUF5110 domain-containing protein, partial [Bacteroidota bacterium]
LFIRAGSIIPQREYASSIQKGTNDVLHTMIYAGANASFELFEDDGISNDYMDGIYAKTMLEWVETGESATLTIAPVQGSFKGMLADRTWNIELYSAKEIESASLNGTPVSFTQNEGMISFESFTAGKSDKQVLEIKLKP